MTGRGNWVRALVLGFAVAPFLPADARAQEMRWGFFSVTLAVIAILDDDLYVGEAVGYLDRTGTIDLRSVRDPAKRCAGRFRYTSGKTGIADMRCDDGAEATMSFNALDTFSGYGRGATPRGQASFTFGLKVEEAATFLALPAGKKLVAGDGGPRLEPAER